MKKTLIIGAVFCFFASNTSNTDAQTIYADVVKGNDTCQGTMDHPVASLQTAVALAAQFTGRNTIIIKIAAGLYLLTDKLYIPPGRDADDTAKFILEAEQMPVEHDWNPYSTPVIQSVSNNNDAKEFDHCAGILIGRKNVSIRGIKFVGNANPMTDYYYPIEKDTALLKNLEISQCYFLGERNGEPIQGAIYAEGEGLKVDHCIFSECKNAVLTFEHTAGLSITHCIIDGAYEAAVWYGDQAPDEPFIFSNNIVCHCAFVWAGSKGHDHSSYTFRNSVFWANEYFIGGQNGHGGVSPLTVKETHHEIGIRNNTKVELVQTKTDGMPANYLNLAPGSAGWETGAGIFIAHEHE